MERVGKGLEKGGKGLEKGGSIVSRPKMDAQRFSTVPMFRSAFTEKILSTSRYIVKRQHIVQLPAFRCSAKILLRKEATRVSMAFAQTASEGIASTQAVRCPGVGQ